MYGMKRSELRLVPHDPEWKNDFLKEKERISAAVANADLRIEHIGSTSIPTVCAKPILDIAILCNTDDLEKTALALTSLGYGYRGQFDDESNHYYAVLDRDGTRFCQTHIYTEANRDWHSKLAFRDTLIRDPELASEYNDYKLALARTGIGKNEYAEIKDKWVDTFVIKVLGPSVDQVEACEINSKDRSKR